MLKDSVCVRAITPYRRYVLVFEQCMNVKVCYTSTSPYKCMVDRVLMLEESMPARRNLFSSKSPCEVATDSVLFAERLLYCIVLAENLAENSLPTSS